MKKSLLIVGVVLLIVGAGVLQYFRNVKREKIETRASIENEGRELNETPKKMEVLETIYKNNTSYSIVDVDGHLYLSQFRGGIIHMESCPCKNK